MRIVTTAVPTAPEAEFPLSTRTAPALWQYVLAQGWTTPAYLEERSDGWREVSWQEAGERVGALGRALLARGIKPGDAVAVVSRTRLEWVLLDWAIMSIGAVVVGLYPTNTASECAYILGHSEAVLAFVEDDEQRAKLASVHDGLPRLGEVIGFDELPAF
jgi:long-chain acyl-CoA synthetase